MQPQSPCKQICKLDHQQEYCVGCWRTITEIQNWTKFSNTEKLYTLQQLEERACFGLD